MEVRTFLSDITLSEPLVPLKVEGIGVATDKHATVIAVVLLWNCSTWEDVVLWRRELVSKHNTPVKIKKLIAVCSHLLGHSRG